MSQVYLLDLAGGEAQRFTTLSTGASNPAFSPDGRAILFGSNVYPGAADDEANKKIPEARTARKYDVRAYDGFPIRNWDRWLDEKQPHLFVQSLEPGAKARDLLAGSALVELPGYSARGSSLDAVWAPDGRSIVFVATTDARFEPEVGKTYALSRVARAAWPLAGEPSVLTAGFDREIGSFAFSPDSSTVYLAVAEAGLERLYAMPAEGGDPRLVLEQDAGMYGGLAVPPRADAATLFVQLSDLQAEASPRVEVRPVGARLRTAVVRRVPQERSGRLLLPRAQLLPLVREEEAAAVGGERRRRRAARDRGLGRHRGRPPAMASAPAPDHNRRRPRQGTARGTRRRSGTPSG